ncbi:MAG: PTS sugar transporter subunit IIC [Thermodesulfobacteriota bacterium]
MIEQALLASVVGAILWLDRFQMLQIMVSRPVVAGPLVGLVLGNVTVGVATAILYELLWIRKPPLGGYIPPDATLASCATTAVAACVAADTGGSASAVVFLAFMILFPVCFLGAEADRIHRKVLGWLARTTEDSLRQTHDRSYVLGFVCALALGFAWAVSILFPVTLVGCVLVRGVWSMLPPSGGRVLECAFYVIPVLGVADLMAARNSKPDRLLFVLGFCIAIGAGLCLGLLFRKS